MSTQQWVIVTGASGGIGKAIAKRLANDGFSILLHYNSNKEAAEKVLQEIVESKGHAQLITFDVSQSQKIEENLDSFFSTIQGDFFGLVNNAGIHIDTMAGLMSDEDFDKVIKTNLYGPFYLQRYCLKKMMRNRKGCIVNIASLAGQVGNAGQLNYSASKAGLIAMTKTLSMELAKRNIRVNAVSPGLIETEMVADIPHINEMIQQIPLKRMGRADEVAGAVSFLFSEDSTYITGQTLSVNGGLFPA